MTHNVLNYDINDKTSNSLPIKKSGKWSNVELMKAKLLIQLKFCDLAQFDQRFISFGTNQEFKKSCF